jgi:cytidylate kinase
MRPPVARGAGRSMVIAIDGPAGAGKSSVARGVARALGFCYLDSGAMYRCVALAALERGAEPAQVASEVAVQAGERVLLDGRDVTEAIRTPAVSEAASKAAADPRVRAALVALQRRVLERGDWVAEGRDIGTVVAPDAALKVFLTACPRVRAHRRALELGADPAVVLAEQTIRDERDATRAHSPLAPAPNALTLDTSALSLAEAVARVVALAREHGAQPRHGARQPRGARHRRADDHGSGCQRHADC